MIYDTKDTAYSNKNYLLVLLLIIFAFNQVDRLALGLVLDNIKVDLSLSDSQLGFLSGIAFALFYSVMGIPIARWADRGNRVTIISLTAAMWSVMVALCGMATSFLQLLLIRVGVGIGEAGCVPPAHSLIADYFTRAERPRAVSIYLQGNTLSVVIGYFAAGWLNELYGWRAMFVLLALPGVALGLLALFTLKEPRVPKRVRTTPAAADVNTITEASTEVAALSAGQRSLSHAFVTLWANATFRHLLFGFSLLSFFNYGLVNWQPVFFVRSFGLKTGELGSWFAAIYGLSGMLGMYWGGVWASRRAPNNEGLQLKAMALVNAVFAGAVWSLIYLSHNYYIAFAWMALSSLGSAAIYGPLYATLQTLVPPRLRAMSIAIFYLFANLIGAGLGPLAVGALSDALRSVFGEESLRYALLAVCPGFLWASWHLWRASRTVTRDIEAIQVGLGNEGAEKNVALNEAV